jgi:hypothetical protein
MKTIRILAIISKRVRRGLSLVLCAFGFGVFATHATVCALSWHPFHGLLAAGALLFVALEFSDLKNARL